MPTWLPNLTTHFQLSHALHVYGLHKHHRDPLDRLLVAQSQLDDLPLITADSVFSDCDIEVMF
jgi:PIN domain nuclease of toxin-antitoxin system